MIRLYCSRYSPMALWIVRKVSTSLVPYRYRPPEQPLTYLSISLLARELIGSEQSSPFQNSHSYTDDTPMFMPLSVILPFSVVIICHIDVVAHGHLLVPGSIYIHRSRDFHLASCRSRQMSCVGAAQLSCPYVGTLPRSMADVMVWQDKETGRRAV